jgi:hypothetical protein
LLLLLLLLLRLLLLLLRGFGLFAVRHLDGGGGLSGRA